jgi:hypothetical protein
MNINRLWLVPKSHSDVLRLITDHGVGQLGLNSHFTKEEFTVRYDKVQDLMRAVSGNQISRRLFAFLQGLSLYEGLPLYEL